MIDETLHLYNKHSNKNFQKFVNIGAGMLTTALGKTRKFITNNSTFKNFNRGLIDRTET